MSELLKLGFESNNAALAIIMLGVIIFTIGWLIYLIISYATTGLRWKSLGTKEEDAILLETREVFKMGPTAIIGKMIIPSSYHTERLTVVRLEDGSEKTIESDSLYCYAKGLKPGNIIRLILDVSQHKKTGAIDKSFVRFISPDLNY
ncbi:MAG: hypothetical protein ACOX0Z_00440 [Candidatus Nanosyncoccaceae bacterium]|jgi:hypothetical protein